nr:MAG: 50S ribosomal protein L31 [Chloroflexota bacterium]
MKANIHPTWYAEATVICACGNTWITGATQPEIRTDICSACHPFFTGEQRIVDTEGQVDRFMKRLQQRDQYLQEAEERAAARTPANLPLTELEINKRYVQILIENGIETAGEFLSRLETDGEDKLVEIPGIGRKVIADIKKALRARGYNLPTPAAAE